MELTLEERNLYRALGELAYVIAKADDVLSRIEVVVFQEAIKEDLGNDHWLAKDRFERLESEGVKANIEATYNRVLFLLKQNKRGLSEDMIEKFISVIEKVAGVSGITDRERTIIEKFREDITNIYNS